MSAIGGAGGPIGPGEDASSPPSVGREAKKRKDVKDIPSDVFERALSYLSEKDRGVSSPVSPGWKDAILITAHNEAKELFNVLPFFIKQIEKKYPDQAAVLTRLLNEGPALLRPTNLQILKDSFAPLRGTLLTQLRAIDLDALISLDTAYKGKTTNPILINIVDEAMLYKRADTLIAGKPANEAERQGVARKFAELGDFIKACQCLTSMERMAGWEFTVANISLKNHTTARAIDAFKAYVPPEYPDGVVGSDRVLTVLLAGLCANEGKFDQALIFLNKLARFDKDISPRIETARADRVIPEWLKDRIWPLAYVINSQAAHDIGKAMAILKLRPNSYEQELIVEEMIHQATTHLFLGNSTLNAMRGSRAPDPTITRRFIEAIPDEVLRNSFLRRLDS